MPKSGGPEADVLVRVAGVVVQIHRKGARMSAVVPVTANMRKHRDLPHSRVKRQASCFPTSSSRRRERRYLVKLIYPQSRES